MTAVVVTAASRSLRRELGPVALAVLVELVTEAREEHGALLVPASARSIGAAVGIAKDTAAAALRRLVAAGVVVRTGPSRDRGRFGAAALRIVLPDGMKAVCAGGAPAVPIAPLPVERDTAAPAGVASREPARSTVIDHSSRWRRSGQGVLFDG